MEENKFFKRDGMDLYLDYPVSVFDIIQEKKFLFLDLMVSLKLN
ncbi:hypothetical protein [Mycoplasmopsis felis]|nr:hypothetical protein [Mycoplasmopsis felis]UWV84469.1 hypothetical protein NWE58_00940 [Mycoplasmopsis felis]